MDDSIPWRKIHDYLIEVCSSRTEQEFHHRAIARIDTVVRCDHVSAVRLSAPGVPECVHGSSGDGWCREFNEYFRYRFPMDWPDVERINVTDFRPWERTEYVADFMRPKRLWSVLWDARRTYILALYRVRRAPSFSDTETASLKLIMAHLNNHYGLLRQKTGIAPGHVTTAELAPGCGLLTRREAHILSHLALRMTAREIASVLQVSHRTVERHVANMYDKLDVHNRQALLRKTYTPQPDDAPVPGGRRGHHELPS